MLLWTKSQDEVALQKANLLLHDAGKNAEVAAPCIKTFCISCYICRRDLHQSFVCTFLQGEQENLCGFVLSNRQDTLVLAITTLARAEARRRRIFLRMSSQQITGHALSGVRDVPNKRKPKLFELRFNYKAVGEVRT